MPNFKPSIVTANLLRSGDVVYLGANERWVRELESALVAHNENELAKLEEAGKRAQNDQLVIDVYAMDVDVKSGKPKARSVREIIRAAHGPSV